MCDLQKPREGRSTRKRTQSSSVTVEQSPDSGSHLCHHHCCLILGWGEGDSGIFYLQENKAKF